MAQLPNLELLLYKAQDILAHDKEFIETLQKRKSENRVHHIGIEFDVKVFPQMWGSTCTGFDITEDGEPVLAGCAMTKEYTTVIHELVTDCYCVFFGDRPCYKVTNANKNFHQDLLKCQMASLSVAKTRY